MFVLLFPNQTGQTQSSVVKIEEVMLQLSTAPPIGSASGSEILLYLEKGKSR
jgi:hypothetical protein